MSQNSTSLNPGASEFVPNFSMPNMSNLSLNDNSQQQSEEQQTYQPPVQENTRYQNNHHNNYHHHQQQNYYHQHQHQQQHPPQRLYGQNHNTSHRHSYNPNYRGNNYRPNYRRENNHHHNNNYNNYNNHHNQGYNQGYHQQQQQPGDVDTFELEARCEAVIEILQDDKIRDQLNPQAQQGGDHDQGVSGDANGPECDEDEMEEMMAMQEECRLEMMKFYIQSQNPALFEEIYHDVSYPDAAAAKTKVPEDELLSPKTMPKAEEAQSTEESPAAALKLTDLIINELNPECAEFVPNKFAEENKSTA